MDQITGTKFALDIVEHTAALRRYAFILMRSQDQADDLVQDCIARALSRKHLYQPDTNLRAWLFTMLRNIFITQARKTNYRRDYALKQITLGPQVTAPNQFHAVELRENVRMMKQLSRGEHQALMLLGVHDLTYNEAAQRSGLHVGTLKSRLSRGRARLRRLSEPLHESL